MSQDSGWDKETCLIAYRKSLALADRHLLVVSSMTSRRELLVSSIPRSLASDAAACAIEAGRIEEAIEMLEQGRTLLWSQVGRYRTPLDALRESSPQLASELESLGQRLEHSVVKLPGKATGKDLDAESQRYRLLSENWDRLVEKIRKLEGFQRFLQPTPFAALQDAASNGPVIIINVSNLRSDAIVIRNNHDPTIVPLPNVGAGYVDDLASQFAKVVSSAPDRTGRAKIISILRLLWDDIMGPAVACLKKMGVPERSRIWLCPTSRLVTLPLHAAGPHRGQNPNLPDLFIPSYTATLSALLTSSGIGPVHSNQLESPRNLSVPPLLLIAQPGAPGASEIESVREELIRIRQAVPLVDALLDEDGCHAKVLAGLFGHRWIHFACHGSQDLLEPFRSRFHLYDEPLTLLEITQARIPDAEFAFLSACHTAAGDQNTPDETIHLAAGLQFSGFKSVIGTLYAMADIDGPHVAEHVYRHMYRQSGRVASYKDAAEGLNIATKFLKTQGVPVERWINFVHIGA
ncbi:hypothetical protein FRC03_010240 [Tulasnella sp. 419]|nr:hypothetical protein FRC03_010240 [Tulasnella sp. 419]